MLLALGFLFALLLITFISTRYVDSHPHANGPVMSSSEQPMELVVAGEKTSRPEEPDLVNQNQDDPRDHRFVHV